jgi:hypothetical protein
MIAGALWKLTKDPVFIDCLNRARTSGLLEVPFHLSQVLWLNDERAIDFLIDLLPQTGQAGERGRYMPRSDTKNQGTDPWALGMLNGLEAGCQPVPPDEKRSPSYYWERRNDPAFRERMARAVQKAIALMHRGR